MYLSRKSVLVFFIIFLTSMHLGCQESQIFTDDSEEVEIEVSSSESTSVPVPSIEEVSISYEELYLETDEEVLLYANVELSDGKVYHGITEYFITPYPSLNGVIVWYSNDADIIYVSTTGKLKAKAVGETTVLASLGNQTTSIAVTVSEEAVEDVVSLTSLSFYQTELDLSTDSST